MPISVSELSAQAHALLPDERARLAEELLASLAIDDPSIESAWNQEIRRRIDEIERGVVETIPATRAFAQARQAIGQ
jgi:putative addiction module component (TIGR02574 family)